MEPQHIIETATFDLDLDGSLDVARIDGELRRVVKAQLLPVVQQVFDEMGADKKSIRLDVLEVDMGTVGFDGSWAPARERLAGALRTALARARSGATGSHGCADAAGVVIAETPDGGGARVRGHALYTALRERLLGQAARGRSGVASLEVEAPVAETPEVEALDVEALDVEALVAALLAEHPQQLQRLLRELCGAHGMMDAAQRSLSRAAWRALVHGFLSLTARGEVATPPSQFLQAIETFAARADRSRSYYAAVLAHLVRDEPVDLEAISTGAQSESEPGTPGPTPADGESRIRGSALYQALRERLLGLGATGGSGVTSLEVEALDVENLVAALLAEHPQQLQRLLRELRSSRGLMDAAQGSLSRAAWKALVHGFLSLNARDGAAMPPQFLQAIETFAARAVSSRSYYAEVLAHLVRDEPVDLEAISAGARTDPERGTQASTPADGESRIRGYALYEALRERLLGHAAPGGSGVAAPDGQPLDVDNLDVESLVAVLLAEHAQQLQRLYRELQSEAVPVEPALALLPGAALRALVRGFLSLASPTEAAAPSQFIQAIETFATRARSSRRYYAQVLTCLVRDELVDLEAIAAGAKVHESPETAAGPARREEGSETSPAADAGTDAHMSADAMLVQLGEYLQHDTLAPGVDAAMLARGVEGMLAHAPERLCHLLREVLVDEASEYRLVALFPERALARVLWLLAPGIYPALQDVADTLAVAAHGPGTGIAGVRVTVLKWRFALHHLLHGGGWAPEAVFQEAAFVQAFAAELARHSSLADVTALREVLARQLALNVLPGERETQLRVLRVLRAEPTLQIRSDRGEARAPVAPTRRMHVTNAGQVLASPYLPLLFERLALTDKGAFISRDAAERAAWLLQFMVDGATQYPQQPIVLNRLLCGLSGPPQPGRDDVPLRAQEMEAIESLLQAMIQHWRIIGNTTLAGLRESFLQREGLLVNGADAWQLRVEPRAYDMLLDHLPWGFSMIKHGWMERALQVTWR